MNNHPITIIQLTHSLTIRALHCILCYCCYSCCCGCNCCCRGGSSCCGCCGCCRCCYCCIVIVAGNGTAPTKQQRGRLVVIGSVEVFGDDWLDKEENAKLCDVLFSWLLGETDLDMTSDRQDADLQEFAPVPHIEALRYFSVVSLTCFYSHPFSPLTLCPSHCPQSWPPSYYYSSLLSFFCPIGVSFLSSLYTSTPIRFTCHYSQSLKPCLQGMEELPRDFTKMFDMEMFKFDVTLIPQAKALYETLGVPHEPLTLIPPQVNSTNSSNPSL